MNIRRAAALAWIVLAAACGGGTEPAVTGRSSPETTAPGLYGEGEWFTDRAEETGLRFVHFNGMSGEFYFPEIMPPGAGLLDYDNDGDLDVYLVQGKMLGTGKTLPPLNPAPGPLPLKGRLYRNDLNVGQDGRRTVSFTDVTDRSGITANGYGMGVAAGDFDNDGCVDLYLTNLGPNQLFRNNCDGTFVDVSRRSGTDDPGWGVSAAFVDYDRDGWLDLYVGNYVRYSIETDIECPSLIGVRDYCPPQVYSAQASRLYHNERNGTFRDVAPTVLGGQFGPALGVVTADFDGDGWIDIFVANDGQQDHLWMNRRNGTFTNTGLQAGVALTADGKPEASMGVDAGDFDNDGDEDLFVTELTGEGSNLFVNDGSAAFDDRSAPSGLGPASLAYTGFATAWLDFDNDGWLDLLAVNGAIQAQKRPGDSLSPYGQRRLLFRNLANGRFEDVSSRAGAAFQSFEVGRGAAFGDVDNDGDTDVLVTNNNGHVRLLVNNVGSRSHWLGLRLVGERPSRDMLGARVGIVRNDGSTLWRRARADGSYASANDPRVLVGLGSSTEGVSVRVRWPSGRAEQWTDVPIDRYTTLTEGTGRAERPGT